MDTYSTLTGTHGEKSWHLPIVQYNTAVLLLPFSYLQFITYRVTPYRI